MISDLPHEGVWTRLGVSPLHGVGVFAIIRIPAGTDVFANDVGKMLWVDAAELDRLPVAAALLGLYHDFAIRRGTLLGCPVNFNNLSVGWYVNEPAPGQRANLAIAEDFAMRASRDIAQGEELTIWYRTFSG